MGNVAAIIVAAGQGKRFGTRKQFATLKGISLVGWCLERFEKHPDVQEIVLVLPGNEEAEKYWQRYKKLKAVVEGGEERQDSVRKGFAELDPKQTEIVLVHDGVRPLVSEDLVGRVIRTARELGAAVPALAIEDTVKEAEAGQVLQTVDRGRLFRVQTPQAFTYPLLKEALDKAAKEGFYGTDEAMLVERAKKKVHLVEGEARNIKITTPTDIKIAEVLLEI